MVSETTAPGMVPSMAPDTAPGMAVEQPVVSCRTTCRTASLISIIATDVFVPICLVAAYPSRSLPWTIGCAWNALNGMIGLFGALFCVSAPGRQIVGRAVQVLHHNYEEISKA